MKRNSGCSKDGMNKGAWTDVEDEMLKKYVKIHGERKWSKVAPETGLKRCGKSCRLRWMNYLRPDIKRGNISLDEEDLIIRLHKLLGNRWSLIAGRLPGRTDNEIKNYWNSSLSKKLVNESRKSFDSKFNKNENKLNNLKNKKSDKELVIVTPPKQNIDQQNQGKMEENNNIVDNPQLSEEFPILSNVMFGDQENLLDFLLVDFDTEDFCKMLGSDCSNPSDVHLMDSDFNDSIQDINGVQVSDDQEMKENDDDHRH